MVSYNRLRALADGRGQYRAYRAVITNNGKMTGQMAGSVASGKAAQDYVCKIRGVWRPAKDEKEG